MFWEAIRGSYSLVAHIICWRNQACWQTNILSFDFCIVAIRSKYLVEMCGNRMTLFTQAPVDTQFCTKKKKKVTVSLQADCESGDRRLYQSDSSWLDVKMVLLDYNADYGCLVLCRSPSFHNTPGARRAPRARRERQPDCWHFGEQQAGSWD